MVHCPAPNPSPGKFWIEGLAVPLIGTFGIVGNTIAISVLLSRRVQIAESMWSLLILLTIFDTSSLIGIVLWMTPGSWSDHFRTHYEPQLFRFLDGAIPFSTIGSIWTTVGIAVERYLIICHNYKSKRIYLYILPIVLGSLLLSMPIFFVWEMHGSRLGPSQLGLSKAIYPDYFVYVLPTLLFFIPVILLFILNVQVLLKIWRLQGNLSHISENNRRDHNRALMLIYVVIIFFLCYFPQFVVLQFITTQEFTEPACAYFGYSERWFIDQSIGYLLTTVNASVNVIIYCFKDEQFWQVAMNITGLDKWKTKKSQTELPTRITTSKESKTQLPTQITASTELIRS